MERNRLLSRCCGGGGLIMANDHNLAKGARGIPKEERGNIRAMSRYYLLYGNEIRWRKFPAVYK